ncbi:MAG: hypothetical protein LBF86_02755 [Helicobacteraceae bacterium]|nr:hypothetical protein [Helicobacteraceae bacterium]
MNIAVNNISISYKNAVFKTAAAIKSSAFASRETFSKRAIIRFINEILEIAFAKRRFGFLKFLTKAAR